MMGFARTAGASALLVLLLQGCHQNSAQDPAAFASGKVQPSEAAATATEAKDELKPGAHDKILQILSSNPDVAVTGVFLDGRPLRTAGLGTAQVRALLVADPEEGNGTPCTSEGLEVRLSNAIIAKPLVNFCNSKYRLEVSAAKPSPPRPLPSALQDFSWQTDGRGNDKMVYLGIPQTDATAMLATCRKGETRAQVKFFQDAGATPTIDIFASDRVLRYTFQRKSQGSSEEAPTNEIDLPIGDQFFALLRGGKPLTYRIEKGEFLPLDAPGRAEKIEEFIAWCSGD